MRTLIKKTFMTKDSQGCQFRATVYKTMVRRDDDGRPVYESEYVADLGAAVTAKSLKDLQQQVGAL